MTLIGIISIYIYIYIYLVSCFYNLGLHLLGVLIMVLAHVL